MMEQDELIAVFVDESIQHLEAIEPHLLDMEKDPDRTDPDTVNVIFRAVHSIKGASGFFGFQKIGKLSHIMENLLSRLRDGEMSATSEFIDALLGGIDALRVMLEDVGASDGIDIEAEIHRLTGLLDPAEASQKIVTVSETPVPEEGTPPKSFDVPERALNRFEKKGQLLYTVSINLKQDLTDNGKTPLDLINTIVNTGELIESRLDIDAIGGLEDCLENDMPFVFVFTTGIEEAYLPDALDIPAEKIRTIDYRGHERMYGSDNFKDLVTPPAPHMNAGEKGSDILCREPDPIEMKAPPPQQPIQETPSPTPPQSVPPKETSSLPPENGEATENMSRPYSPPPISGPRNARPSKPPKTDNQGVRSSAAASPMPTIQSEEKIRVGIGFLNDLVSLAGEMVLGRNQLNQIVQPLVKETPELNPVIQHISRITTEMQEKIMQMRMQPVSMIFGKFQRVVRDLSKKLEKEIRLVTYGDEVELDKSIIEALSDPLTHLIRNGVDHGIEHPRDREEAGKPRQGTIQLKAYHQGGHVYIDIIDDGAGIDCRWIGEKAVKKGLISHDQMVEMDEKELAKLIFKPGFSTAAQVSDVSGRGVGMDVVLTNIEQLGGTVNVHTKLHEGTTISLVLPLTLAIVSGLVIQTTGQNFILPEANINELVRIKPDEIETRINTIQNSKVLRLRDMLLPLVSLSEVLGLPNEPMEKQTDPVRVLVIKHGSSLFGLLVDAVESIEEIVVKPLPRYLKNQKCFSGASIMGNGDVSLILDVAGLFEKAGLHHMGINKLGPSKETEAASATRDLQTLLLFDNKTDERFALPLEQITRIERIKTSDIEKVKNQSYLQYQGEKLKLVFLEDHLPVEPPRRTDDETIGVIVPKHIKYPLGIVIHGIAGSVTTEVEVDTQSIKSPAIFGSTILDGKITLLPDMYKMFEMAAPEWYAEASDTSESSKDHGKFHDDDGTAKRILLVEDTPFFRTIEKNYLTSAGYDVLEAENGKQALDILSEQKVDAVILDIIMPVMDGFETIQRIRKDNVLKHLPVMGVSSLSDEKTREKARLAKFTRWEPKLDKERLLKTLEEMLEAKAEEAA